jgi:hypothetical protein
LPLHKLLPRPCFEEVQKPTGVPDALLVASLETGGATVVGVADRLWLGAGIGAFSVRGGEETGVEGTEECYLSLGC